MTRPGYCAWAATRRGWAFRSSRARWSWPMRRLPAAHWGASAAIGSAPSCGCWPARPTRSERFVGLGSLGLDAAIQPGLGLRDPDLARDALTLLPRGRRSGDAGPGGRLWPVFIRRHGARCSTAWPFPPATATGSSMPRTAPELARRLGRSQAPSDIAAAVGSAGPEAVALAGAFGARDPARRWLGGLRDVGLEISGSDLISAGIAPGPAIGRGLAAALAARLDGQRPGPEHSARRRPARGGGRLG